MQLLPKWQQWRTNLTAAPPGWWHLIERCCHFVTVGFHDTGYRWDSLHPLIRTCGWSLLWHCFGWEMGEIDKVPVSSKCSLQSQVTLLIHPHCLHKAAATSTCAPNDILKVNWLKWGPPFPAMSLGRAPWSGLEVYQSSPTHSAVWQLYFTKQVQLDHNWLPLTWHWIYTYCIITR